MRNAGPEAINTQIVNLIMDLYTIHKPIKQFYCRTDAVSASWRVHESKLFYFFNILHDEDLRFFVVEIFPFPRIGQQIKRNDSRASFKMRQHNS